MLSTRKLISRPTSLTTTRSNQQLEDARLLGREELIPHVTTGCGGQGISVVHVEALAPFRPPGQLVCADPDDQELCAGIWPVAALARNGEARSMTTGATPRG
jgi:hypothetical protein